MTGLNAWGREPTTLQNHTIDSTRWRHFRFRSDDIVIGTWAKSGTSWLQQIIGQLLFPGTEDLPVMETSPWIEQRWYPLDAMLERLEAQTHRRFVKTHLPADALIFSPQARYIYIGRDGRDVLWSWYHHHANLRPLAYKMTNETPGRIGPPLGPADPDIRNYF